MSFVEVKYEFFLRFYYEPMAQGTWKKQNNIRPVILNRTKFLNQLCSMRYSEIDNNLFALTTYNNTFDTFEHV